MIDIIIERDIEGICPICKKKITEKTKNTRFKTYRDKKILVCSTHKGCE